ncbi:MAG: FAD-dependent oxidoreductase [Burkholderiaceae bacterium]
MRIAVIGAGLAGVTTAYELSRDGHDVAVYERRGSIAAEGSFAPSNVSAPGLWLAHAAAGMPTGSDHPAAGAAFWSHAPWRWRQWRLGRQPAQPARWRCMRELSQLSQSRLRAAEAAHQLDYEHHRGVVALLRHPRHAERAQALLGTDAAAGLPVQWLGPDQVRGAEPGLSPSLPVEGALYWPQGETANGRQFAHALKAEAQRLGARFLFQQEVTALATGASAGGRVEVQATACSDLGDSSSLATSATGATTVADEGPQSFDAVVLCTATGAASLLGARGLRLPFATAHLHSVTAPLRAASELGDAFGPAGALLDPAAGVTLCRMGERLRVSGAAQWGAPPARPKGAALARLYRALDECFPGAARTARPQVWVGRQDHFADGLPALGPSGVADQVWLNLGHGGNRWAWAGATARLLADQLAGRAAELDLAPLAPARLR